MGEGIVSRRKICVVTGSRADYGHLYWLLREIKDDIELSLQLIATGAHLSARYGMTYKDIESDGFRIDKKINILKYSDTDKGMAASLGVACRLFAEALECLQPDILVVLGDRYEIFAAAIAAHILKIPIAHIHGGELSEGAIDDAFRHAITKLSHIHFPATEEYKHRIIQLGENPRYVFNYGAPGLDNLFRLKLLKREQLSTYLGIDFRNPTAIFTYHPVTLERNTIVSQIRDILRQIRTFALQVIFTKANADAGGLAINKEIERFCRSAPEKYKLFDNLGQIKYFSCMKYCRLMIGNSSSGIIEAASFKLPVVNIGDRQRGRIAPENVIHAKTLKDVKKAICLALSEDFKKKIKGIKNPYLKVKGGKVSVKIKDKLKSIPLGDRLRKKRFYDIKF